VTTTATIIGGGPAGLIAAETLADAGCAVTVYEHMPSVGRKLLLAGRSGLNLTHHEPLADLLDRYGEADVVRDAVRAFDTAALRAWAEGLGEGTFVGSSGRVFPHSMRATPLLRAWLARLSELGVQLATRHRWAGWTDGGSCRFVRADAAVLETAADITVFALGGASWPRVGSDGGWVQPFRQAGVLVHELRPANCGVHITWSDTFRDRFAGTPLKNVALRALHTEVRGDAMVTTTGLESGPVYPLSALVRDELQRSGTCTIHVDLRPDLTSTAIAARLAHRRPKESLSTWLRRTLALQPAAIGLLREATGNSLPDEPTRLAELLGAVPLTVHAVAPIDRAISSAGGIALTEIDERFMLRRRPGTFVAGEMLDWEAPTGGYLLQATFATGVAAARGALAWVTAGRPPGGNE